MTNNNIENETNLDLTEKNNEETKLLLRTRSPSPQKIHDDENDENNNDATDDNLSPPQQQQQQKQHQKRRKTPQVIVEQGFEPIRN